MMRDGSSEQVGRAVLNLVGTRCTDGQYGALERWYNDHAQLLMASAQLQRAQLYRLQVQSGAAQAAVLPEYLCLYEFACWADFAQFDAGAVMAQVRACSDAAAGRSSVEMVQRSQFERLLCRRWVSQAGADFWQLGLLKVHQAGEPAVPLAQQMQHIERWLNDVVYGLHRSAQLVSAQVYASSRVDQVELFVLLQAPGALPLNWYEVGSAYAAQPGLQVIWQAQAQPIAQWLR